MRISVIIPTHNRLSGLKIAVKSVFEQTIVPYELIVIDDGSTDPVDYDIFNNAPEGLKCLLLTNETPRGGNNARNKGIFAATGEYIAFLDDDDEFFNNKIESINEMIHKYPDFDLFYHKAEIHMVKEGYVYYSRPSEFENPDEGFRSLLIKNWVGGTPMVIVKKKSVIDVGGFDEEMPAMQDYELWLRMAKEKKKFKRVNKALTKYNYITKQTTVSKSVTSNDRAIVLIEKKFENDYKKLTKNELAQYEQWKQKNIIHRAILNGQKKVALKGQLQQLYNYPNFSNLLKVFAVVLGPSFIYKLKSKGF